MTLSISTIGRWFARSSPKTSGRLRSEIRSKRIALNEISSIDPVTKECLLKPALKAEAYVALTDVWSKRLVQSFTNLWIAVAIVYMTGMIVVIGLFLFRTSDRSIDTIGNFIKTPHGGFNNVFHCVRVFICAFIRFVFTITRPKVFY